MGLSWPVAGKLAVVVGGHATPLTVTRSSAPSMTTVAPSAHRVARTAADEGHATESLVSLHALPGV